MELVDSHCHLDASQFDEDREAAIERARAAGVKYFLSIGTGNGPPDLQSALRLADAYSFVYATAGVHPNDVQKIESGTLADLRDLLDHPKVVALGEIGLDYHWGIPKEPQMAAFTRQLEIAAEAQKPVVIHTRDAWQDTIEILRSVWVPAKLPCIMHCFSGTPDQARECIDLDFHLSFGGIATFPKSSELREAARVAPANRLLVETDCPYLAPVPFRGKRNEPAYVAYTAEVLAKVRGVPLADFAAQTTRNFEALFHLGHPLN